MDKKLITGLLVLLIFESILLMSELGFIHSPFSSSQKKTALSAGHIEQIVNNVHTKQKSSLLWEKGTLKQPLNLYDSVLTLEESSSKVVLKNDSEIHLQANTLIMIEPSSDHQSTKITFKKGLFNGKTNVSPLDLEANGWSIEVTPNSQLTLRKSTNNNIEVDIHKGKIKASLGQKTHSFSEEEFITINKNNTVSQKKVDSKLQWSPELKKRIYFHNSPPKYKIKWSGNADTLVVNHSSGTEKEIPIKKGQNHFSFNTIAGTYTFRLLKKKTTSTYFQLDIRKAKNITFYSPLPRHRTSLNSQQLFSWSKYNENYSYQLELINRATQKTTLVPVKSRDTLVEYPFQKEGLYIWKVRTIDDDGYIIPSFNQYEIHAIEKPLKAPQLIQPEQIRKPAKSSKSSSFLMKLSNFLFPKAHASEVSILTKRTLTFSWFEVKDADYYIIEISSSKGFQSPEVIQKVAGTQFKWTQFKKQIYYWRVAAGSNKGRMGLFSDPAQLDLTTLNLSDNKTLVPGVRYEIVNLEQKKVNTAAPILDKKASQPSTTAPLPLRSLNWKQSLEIGFHHYDLQLKKQPNNVRYKGFEDYLVGYSLNIPLKEKGHVLISAQTRELEWKPKSNLVFQNKMNIQLTQIKISHSNNHSTLSYGIQFNQSPYYTKSSSEEVSLNRKDQLGIHLSFKNPISEKAFIPIELQYDYHKDIETLSINTQIDYRLKSIFNNSSWVTGKIQMQSFNGNQLTGTNYLFGISLKLEL